MKKRLTLESYKEAFREIKKEAERRRFLLHLSIFGVVSFMFLIVNWLYFPDEAWFLYPIVGWGFGLMVHYLLGVRWIDTEITQTEAETEYRARGK